MSNPITAFTQLVGQAFAEKHPEIQELVLERMDAFGDHTVRCDWTDDGRIVVAIDRVEIATVTVPDQLTTGSETSQP